MEGGVKQEEKLFALQLSPALQKNKDRRSVEEEERDIIC